MATSGTYSFTVTRDDLIAGALRVLQVYGVNDPIPAEVTTAVAWDLNVWVKSRAMSAMFLWCVQDISVPMVAAQSAYKIGPLSNQPRPMRILDAYLRSPTGNDVALTITSRYDYDTLGQKAAQGIPNQLFYDPQLGNGVVTLYNVPVDASYTLHLVIQRQIQDFNLASDNPDFPQEAYQFLKWGLAAEIGLEQSANPAILDRVEAKALSYRKEFEDFQQAQEASVFFTPTQRRM